MAGKDKVTEKSAEAAPPFADMASTMNEFATAYGEAMGQWMNAWSGGNGANPAKADTNGTGQVKIDPTSLMNAQTELLQGYQALWMSTTRRLLDPEAETEPAATPEPGDNRFKDPAWQENPVFDYIKQAYLLNSAWLRRILGSVEGIDADAAQKLEFMGRQLIDALSPGNHPLTNPVVARETAETKGQNLIAGMKNLMDDASRSDGRLAIRQTDMDAFEVGKNVAVSPGSVVFQNELFQLVQYAPTTDTVHAKPLLIVPPWINKFYILDLRPDNSFIKWMTDQGYSVFVMSWVNPDETYADKSFDDYISDGIFAALDAVEKATGERQVTAIGYCIGGTLLAAALAYMGATGNDRITAATFFAAQVDFADAGELRLFTEPSQVDALEAEVRKKGYLDGAAMAGTFNMLRANDLIWYFVINNYLLGKEPPAFDLLFWNADSTRFPAQMLMDYLRKLYQQNQLATPGKFTVLGKPIDLSDINIPIYIQASKEDHIAPAASVFKMTRLFSGPTRFMLAGSGHIAGVINPPAKNKYQFWINGNRKTYATVEEWLADAKETPGSWWPDWDKWLSAKSGERVAARQPGSGRLKVLEPAPGSYVKVRS